MLDKVKEECGVFGISTPDPNVDDVVSACYFGLYALQPVSYTHLIT